MFFEGHNNIDHQQRQKTGNFPQWLNHADMISAQTGNFYGEIVEQRQPGLQPDGGTDG